MKRVLCILLALLMLSLSACAVVQSDAEQNVDLPIHTRGSAAEPSARASDSAADTTAQASAPGAEADTEPVTEAPHSEAVPTEPGLQVHEGGVYDSKEEVALYIHLFGHLPSNYITKKEAEKLGWPGGSLEPYAPGKCIGGSHFGNYEGLLPDAKGRSWTECDIDTLGKKSRGAKRIIFSNDGLIYYTGDHYEHFELLYGEED